MSDQVLSTKEIYWPQRVTEVRKKGETQEIEKGGGEKKRGVRNILSVRGVGKICFKIERRQTWHIGQWWFIKEQGETPC